MIGVSEFNRYQLFIIGGIGILFNMSFIIFDNLSDTLVVTNIGSDGLSFLRATLLFPIILLTAKIYKNLMNSMRKEIVLYFFLASIGLLTIFYVFILSPLASLIEIDREHLKYLITQYPHFRIPLTVYGNWTVSFFYCINVIYVQTVQGLVLIKITENVVINKKVLPPVLAAIVGIGRILMCLIIMNINVRFPDWNQAISIYTGMILLIIIFICALYNKMNIDFRNETYYIEEKELKRKENHKKPVKIHFKKAISAIFKDKITFYLVMTILFASTHTIVELVWKNEAHIAYPTKLAYSSFIANIYLMSSIGYTIFGFIAIYTLKHWKWITNTTIPTYFLLIFSVIFFILYNFMDSYINLGFIKFQLSTPLFVSLGSFIMIIYMCINSKIFLPTAHKAYHKMTADQEGKAQIDFDFLGDNAGTMLIAVFIQICLCFSNLSGISSILGLFLVILCLVRLYYIYKLKHALQL